MKITLNTTLQEIYENEIELPDFGSERNLVLSAFWKTKLIYDDYCKKEDIYSHYDEDDPEYDWINKHPEMIQTIIEDWTEALDYSFAYSDCYWNALNDILERYMGDDNYEN